MAGLSQKQAQSVIEYRNVNGSFINREELKLVKGIGAVAYQNCAGFVRIIPKDKHTTDSTVKFFLIAFVESLLAITSSSQSSSQFYGADSYCSAHVFLLFKLFLQ